MPRRRPHFRTDRLPSIRGALALLALAACTAPASAAVYRCVDPVTGAVTSTDTPCRRERVPTAAEAAASAEAARLARIGAESRRTIERTERQLLARFADPASHRAAGAAEIAFVSNRIDVQIRRLRELTEQRTPLEAERQFYNGKPLPPELQLKFDANDASLDALAAVFGGLEQEVARIVERHAGEQEILLRLWAGMQPASTGSALPPPAGAR